MPEFLNESVVERQSYSYTPAIKYHIRTRTYRPNATAECGMVSVRLLNTYSKTRTIFLFFNKRNNNKNNVYYSRFSNELQMD